VITCVICTQKSVVQTNEFLKQWFPTFLDLRHPTERNI